MTDVEINTKGLDKLLKALKAKPPVARIGILGDSGAREGGGKTNAEIGAVHEFGTSRHPVRSFLRLPLTTLLDKELAKAGAFDKDVLAQVVAQGTVVPWLKKVAVVGEGIVLGAFDTGGYGTWIPSYGGEGNPRTGLTLVDTQQLRNSITSEVVE